MLVHLILKHFVNVHLMWFLYYVDSLPSGLSSVYIPVGFVLKDSSLKGTIPIKANGFKSKKPFSLTGGSEFVYSVSAVFSVSAMYHSLL